MDWLYCICGFYTLLIAAYQKIIKKDTIEAICNLLIAILIVVLGK